MISQYTTTFERPLKMAFPRSRPERASQAAVATMEITTQPINAARYGCLRPHALSAVCDRRNAGFRRGSGVEEEAEGVSGGVKMHAHVVLRLEVGQRRPGSLGTG